VSLDVKESEVCGLEVVYSLSYGCIDAIFILNGLILGDLLVGFIVDSCDHP